MKIAVIVVLFLVSGFFLFLKPRMKAPPPPPPPPPPAEEVEPPPPLIDAEQEARVIQSTQDQDPEVRWQAITLLDNMGSERAYEIMFERLHRDDDIHLREKIIERLQVRKNAEITQNLVWATKDIDSRIRIAALKALREVGDPRTAAAITEALQDTDEAVRLEALRTLNKLEEVRQKQVAAAAEKKRQYEEARRKALEAQEAAK